VLASLHHSQCSMLSETSRHRMQRYLSLFELAALF
jgi:hypothetical protein